MLYLVFSICLVWLACTCTKAEQLLSDCPDGYWDCLFTDESGHVQHSLGGFSYGRCMNYAKRKCLTCRPEMDDPSIIVARCNALVPECLGRCNIFADLYSCCYIEPQQEQLPPLDHGSANGPVRRLHVMQNLGMRNRGVGEESDEHSAPASKPASQGTHPAQEAQLGETEGKQPGVCGNLPPGPLARKEACGF